MPFENTEIDSSLLTLSSCKIDEICRGCLKTNKVEMYSLLESNIFPGGGLSTTKDFFLSFLGLEIKEHDMPKMMCSECFKSFTAAYVFKKQCEKSDIILNQFIRSKSKYITSTDDNFSNHLLHQTHSDVPSNLENNVNKTTDKHGKNLNSLHRKNKRNEIIQLKRRNELEPSNINHSIDEEQDQPLCDSDDDICLHDLSGNHRKKFKKVVDPDVRNESNNINEKHILIINSSTERNGIEERKVEESLKFQHNMYQCSVCGNSFASERGLRLHTRIHGSEDFACVTCRRILPDASSLKEHKLTHVGDKPFKCSYCDKKFAQKKPLQYHEKTHTGERPHVCEVCGKSYIQPHNLVVHRRLHTGEKPFVCTHCGKAFTNGASLTLHMPVHTGAKDYVCTTCGKRMARSGELTIHMRTHTGEKPYVCRTCSKAFIKKSSLQAHIYSHTGEKKFVCPICGHRVAHAGKLTVHIRTHSSAKPFACPICDRKFANRGYLKQHSKIHSGERAKPFVCIQCGRSFSKNRTLTEHLRTHTGERPFVCSVCNHGFAQRSTLNFHMKSAHLDSKTQTFKETASEETQNVTNCEINKKSDRDSKKVSEKTLEQKDHLAVEEYHSVRTLETPEKLIKRNDSASVSTSLYPNPTEISHFRNSSSFIQNTMCDLKNGFDHRAAYDPRLLGFLHYPL